MKIERNEVERLLGLAEDNPNKAYPLYGPEVIAFCRAWLALVAAPEGEVVAVRGSDTIGMLETTIRTGRSHRNGTRVRLVPTHSAGGE